MSNFTILNIPCKGYVKLEIEGVVLKAYESEGNITEYDLNGITHLNCADNKLQTLPKFPNGITFLDCSHNDISIISELPESLKILNCSHNRLLGLPTLPKTIDMLQCSYNNLREIKTLPESLNYLLCDHNPLIFIVPWTVKLGYSEVPENFQQIFDRYTNNYTSYRLKYEIYQYLITYLALDSRVSPSILTNNHFWFPASI